MTAHPLLPEHEWLAGLVRAYVGSSVLLTDPDDRVLLLKSTYRDLWQFPGGVIDPGEDPDTCARRELHEETGLAVPGLRLVVVEWRDAIPAQDSHAHPAVQFMFDGGTVAPDSPVRLQAEEVSDYGFFPQPKARLLLHELAAQRLGHALQARRETGTVFLHTPGYLG